MNNMKWFWVAIGYQCGFAYLVSLVVTRIGDLIAGNGFSVWTIVAFVIIVAFVYLLVRPAKTAESVKGHAATVK